MASSDLRLINALAQSPLRICQSLHRCCLCRQDITIGQKYFDRGLNRRAHEDCLKSVAQQTLLAINSATPKQIKEAAERIRANKAYLALRLLWKSLLKIDNGTCAICRCGYRKYDTKGNVSGKCSNQGCISHLVEGALKRGVA